MSFKSFKTCLFVKKRNNNKQIIRKGTSEWTMNQSCQKHSVFFKDTFCDNVSTK